MLFYPPSTSAISPCLSSSRRGEVLQSSVNNLLWCRWPDRGLRIEPPPPHSSLSHDWQSHLWELRCKSTKVKTKTKTNKQTNQKKNLLNEQLNWVETDRGCVSGRTGSAVGGAGRGMSGISLGGTNVTGEGGATAIDQWKYGDYRHQIVICRF